MIRIWVKDGNFLEMMVLEPKRDAFGRYKTKDYINTTAGRIPRKNVIQIEDLDEGISRKMGWLDSQEDL